MQVVAINAQLFLPTMVNQPSQLPKIVGSGRVTPLARPFFMRSAQ